MRTINNFIYMFEIGIVTNIVTGTQNKEIKNANEKLSTETVPKKITNSTITISFKMFSVVVLTCSFLIGSNIFFKDSPLKNEKIKTDIFILAD